MADSDPDSASDPRPLVGAKKKPKSLAQFKATWVLPPGIAASKKKGIHFAFCKYCNIDFSVSHGGFNDVTRHVDNQTHKKNARVVAGNTSLESFGPVVRDSLATKVITAVRSRFRSVSRARGYSNG